MRAILRIVGLIGVLGSVSAAQGDLDSVLAELESTKDAAADQRAAVVDKLCAIKLRPAREAALRWYRRERDPDLKARFLEHAAFLPTLDPKINLDKEMLAELERGNGLGIRAVAAAYFAKQRGNDGVDLCMALLAERKDMVLHQAVIAGFGMAGGVRCATLFAKRFAALPPTAKLAVLRELRGKKGAHLESARRAALDDPYGKLAGEAMSQLAASGDRTVAAKARKLAKGKKAAVLAPTLFEVVSANPRVEDLVTLGELLAHRSGRMRRLTRQAVDRLAKLDWARQWAIGDGRAHRNEHVRGFALRILEKLDAKLAAEALFDLASDTNGENRRRAVYALAKNGDRRVVPVLEKSLAKGKVDARLDSLEALDMLLGEERTFQTRLLEYAKAGPAELRLLAIDLAGKHGLVDLLGQVPSLLANRDWRVRAAGVRYAGRVRNKASIGPLVSLLQRERGRLAADIRSALSSLTRLYFERPQDWKGWWSKEAAGFELPPADDSKKPGKVDQNRASGGGATTAEFYGIPVVSDRVIYCLDISGSMAKLAGTGISRIRVAQETLAQALKKSSKKALVNVLFFENKVRRYSKRMVAMRSPKQVEKIITFVRKQRPLGGTNIYDTLVQALEDKRVDTIFLMSDGEPTEGEITEADELVDDIVRRNRGRGVVIHTVSIGGPSPLLQRLAVRCGGTYVVQK